MLQSFRKDEESKMMKKEIKVKVGKVELGGFLTIPSQAKSIVKGIVLFAHGSGSSRHSPRNQFVARLLNEGGLATLLIDLLSPDEETVDIETRELRFNIPFLAKRLAGATDWLVSHPETKHLSIGYFGASTGAAAALVAAADRAKIIKAVVSRGGRPDLAEEALEHVKAPTLLIVGGDDFGVIELNQEAFKQLKGEKRLEIVPHATHLFEEPGTLERVAELSREWFTQYLK
jgi:putative phosphoribosyl transferase